MKGARAVLSGLVVGALCGCVTRAPIPSTVPTHAGVGLPMELTLPLFPQGKPHALASDRGSVVLLDVWATWCEPCKDALPVYQDLGRQYGPRGLKVYAINVDEDPREVPLFVQQFGITVPILLDPHGQAAETVLGVELMPTTFLIDRKGVLRQVHRGYAPDYLAKYQTEIEELLAER